MISLKALVLARMKDMHFFHFFGMSCFARQGKLHSSHYHVEKLLREYGFNIEHENVYYTKCLNQIESKEDSEIYFSKGNNEQTIHFFDRFTNNRWL